jgi:hypothetical protein
MKEALPLSDSRFMLAAQKRRVLRDWCRFLDGGLDPHLFTQGLYHHLIQHCSFIAHYNRMGFAEAYLADPSGTQRFLCQFDRSQGCRSVEYGDTGWLDAEDYHDINMAMVDETTERLSGLRQTLRDREVAKARIELAQAEGRLKQFLGTQREGN